MAVHALSYVNYKTISALPRFNNVFFLKKHDIYFDKTFLHIKYTCIPSIVHYYLWQGITSQHPIQQGADVNVKEL